MEVILVSEGVKPHTGHSDQFYDATYKDFTKKVMNNQFDGSYADYLHCIKYNLVK